MSGQICCTVGQISLPIRFQVGSTSGILSLLRPNTGSVIQGSVLGLLLYTLCVNGIFRVIHHDTPFLFAGDIDAVYSFELSPLPPNHGQHHGGIKLTRLVVWAIGDALLCN